MKKKEFLLILYYFFCYYCCCCCYCCSEFKIDNFDFDFDFSISISLTLVDLFFSFIFFNSLSTSWLHDFDFSWQGENISLRSEIEKRESKFNFYCTIIIVVDKFLLIKFYFSIIYIFGFHLYFINQYLLIIFDSIDILTNWEYIIE